MLQDSKTLLASFLVSDLVPPPHRTAPDQTKQQTPEQALLTLLAYSTWMDFHPSIQACKAVLYKTALFARFDFACMKDGSKNNAHCTRPNQTNQTVALCEVVLDTRQKPSPNCLRHFVARAGLRAFCGRVQYTHQRARQVSAACRSVMFVRSCCCVCAVCVLVGTPAPIRAPLLCIHYLHVFPFAFPLGPSAYRAVERQILAQLKR